MAGARLIIRRPDGLETEAAIADELTLGRLPENDVVLDDPAVSRRHAVIRFREGGGHVLIDLGSANGTLVGGRRIEIPTPLHDHDELRIAGFNLVYRSESAPSEVPADAELDDRTLYERAPDRPQLLGTSRAMAPVFELIEQAASSPIPVLIEGETGTGKELVARAIHRASPRGSGPFIAINCAAIAENILESELFGHRRGSFTGATQDKKGLFEAANGGSIFLDEIGEMPLAMQPKLLRVLQEGEISPVGETRARPVDVRILSATNRDLLAQTEDGSFRSDLYYRLAAFPIRIPPLRDRRDDIPLIAERLLAAAAHRHHKRLAGIAPDALELLIGFAWPGNVRELQNEIERGAAIARDGEAFGATHLSERIRGETNGSTASPGERISVSSSNAPTAPTARMTEPTGPLRNARAAFESRYITQVLAEQGGNVTRAARVLGLSRYALQKKIKEYGLR
jgi:two-component system, NtrC family, response regulator AtoC